MAKMSEKMQAIDAIRRRNEILLRVAITHLMDVGWNNITPESVKYTSELIRKREEENEKNGIISVMTADFQIAILETALELKEFSPVTILTYASRYLEYCE